MPVSLRMFDLFDAILVIACANIALGASTPLNQDLENNATVRHFPIQMTLAANAVAIMDEHDLYDSLS